MNKSNIPISDLEKLAANRDTWRSVCAIGLSTLVGGATVLKVGDNFASGASQKKLDPPTHTLFGQWGTKYCLDS